MITFLAGAAAGIFVLALLLCLACPPLAVFLLATIMPRGWFDD